MQCFGEANHFAIRNNTAQRNGASGKAPHQAKGGGTRFFAAMYPRSTHVYSSRGRVAVAVALDTASNINILAPSMSRGAPALLAGGRSTDVEYAAQTLQRRSGVVGGRSTDLTASNARKTRERRARGRRRVLQPQVTRRDETQFVSKIAMRPAWSQSFQSNHSVNSSILGIFHSSL